MVKKVDYHVGIVVDETTVYTLEEVCDICGVHAEWIIEMVEYGVVAPRGKTMQQWQFTHKELELSKRALRLQQDLELNAPGIAMALDLMEQIDALQQRLNWLEHHYHKLLHTQK